MDFKGSQVKLYMGDKLIGEAQSVEAETVVIKKSRSVGMSELSREEINKAIQGEPWERKPLLNGWKAEGSLVSVDFAQLELKMMAHLMEQNPAFDINIINRGRPARCHKMTKNKRIRKKWLKKYGKPGVQRRYLNCYISGYSEGEVSTMMGRKRRWTK